MRSSPTPPPPARSTSKASSRRSARSSPPTTSSPSRPARALAEVFAATGLGDRIVSLQDLEARRARRARLGPGDHRPALRSRRPSSRRPGRARSAAASRASTTPRAPARRRSGMPLLEVYSPIHEVWSGKIIAVAEFYEVAAALERDLADARATAGCSSPASSSPAGSCCSASCAPAAAPSRASGRCSRRRSPRAGAIAAQNGELGGARSAPRRGRPRRPSAASAGSAPTCTTARRSTSRSPRCGSTA